MLLKSNGWSLLRITGSHHIFGKAGQRVKISVPIHGNRKLGPGLQNHLMEVAGLTREDLA